MFLCLCIILCVRECPLSPDKANTMAAWNLRVTHCGTLGRLTNDLDSFTISQHSVPQGQTGMSSTLFIVFILLLYKSLRDVFLQDTDSSINQNIAEYRYEQENNHESKIQLTHKGLNLLYHSASGY